jgi:hypothetical protein
MCALQGVSTSKNIEGTVEPLPPPTAEADKRVDGWWWGAEQGRFACSLRESTVLDAIANGSEALKVRILAAANTALANAVRLAEDAARHAAAVAKTEAMFIVWQLEKHDQSWSSLGIGRWIASYRRADKIDDDEFAAALLQRLGERARIAVLEDGGVVNGGMQRTTAVRFR